MKSNDVSVIALHPFVRRFVLAIVQDIRADKFVRNSRHVIYADLVPRISGRVAQASLRESIIPKKNEVVLAPPVVRPRVNVRPPAPRAIVPPVVRPPMPQGQQISPPPAPYGRDFKPSENYGKIIPLLNDPSVSTIECQGADKPLVIIRTGQRQMTKIVLSAGEIKTILKHVSDVAHIPLLEGVFRAAVDNFSINAVISEMIGSRFVIKKATPYGLLER